MSANRDENMCSPQWSHLSCPSHNVAGALLLGALVIAQSQQKTIDVPYFETRSLTWRELSQMFIEAVRQNKQVPMGWHHTPRIRKCIAMVMTGIAISLPAVIDCMIFGNTYPDGWRALLYAIGFAFGFMAALIGSCFIITIVVPQNRSLLSLLKLSRREPSDTTGGGSIHE